MRQRVAIAIALSCEPKLLIADEPTTALDVTVQAQILDLLAREQQRRHMAMILITHDLGVVAGRTDEVAVMYAGRVVERAPTPRLFTHMRMPYTEALLAAIPKLDSAAAHAAAGDRRPAARSDAAAARLLVRAALQATPTQRVRAHQAAARRSRSARARCIACWHPARHDRRGAAAVDRRTSPSNTPSAARPCPPCRT